MAVRPGCRLLDSEESREHRTTNKQVSEEGVRSKECAEKTRESLLLTRHFLFLTV